MVHRLLLFFHDSPACSIASGSCSNTSLAVVRPCIAFTQSNSSVTSNWLLTPRKNRELSIIIYVSTLIQSHRIRTETFAFDIQLDLFSDNDCRTIHYPAYYSVTCQNDRRHSSKISIFNDFVAISCLPLRKKCSSRKYNFKVPGVA